MLKMVKYDIEDKKGSRNDVFFPVKTEINSLSYYLNGKFELFCVMSNFYSNFSLFFFFFERCQ